MAASDDCASQANNDTQHDETRSLSTSNNKESPPSAVSLDDDSSALDCANSNKESDSVPEGKNKDDDLVGREQRISRNTDNVDEEAEQQSGKEAEPEGADDTGFEKPDENVEQKVSDPLESSNVEEAAVGVAVSNDSSIVEAVRPQAECEQEIEVTADKNETPETGGSGNNGDALSSRDIGDRIDMKSKIINQTQNDEEVLEVDVSEGETEATARKGEESEAVAKLETNLEDLEPVEEGSQEVNGGGGGSKATAEDPTEKSEDAVAQIEIIKPEDPKPLEGSEATDVGDKAVVDTKEKSDEVTEMEALKPVDAKQFEEEGSGATGNGDEATEEPKEKKSNPGAESEETKSSNPASAVLEEVVSTAAEEVGGTRTTDGGERTADVSPEGETKTETGSGNEESNDSESKLLPEAEDGDCKNVDGTAISTEDPVDMAPPREEGSEASEAEGLKQNTLETSSDDKGSDRKEGKPKDKTKKKKDKKKKDKKQRKEKRNASEQLEASDMTDAIPTGEARAPAQETNPEEDATKTDNEKQRTGGEESSGSEGCDDVICDSGSMQGREDAGAASSDTTAGGEETKAALENNGVRQNTENSTNCESDKKSAKEKNKKKKKEKKKDKKRKSKRKDSVDGEKTQESDDPPATEPNAEVNSNQATEKEETTSTDPERLTEANEVEAVSVDEWPTISDAGPAGIPDSRTGCEDKDGNPPKEEKDSDTDRVEPKIDGTCDSPGVSDHAKRGEEDKPEEKKATVTDSKAVEKDKKKKDKRKKDKKKKSKKLDSGSPMIEECINEDITDKSAEKSEEGSNSITADNASGDVEVEPESAAVDLENQVQKEDARKEGKKKKEKKRKSTVDLSAENPQEGGELSKDERKKKKKEKKKLKSKKVAETVDSETDGNSKDQKKKKKKKKDKKSKKDKKQDKSDILSQVYAGGSKKALLDEEFGSEGEEKEKRKALEKDKSTKDLLDEAKADPNIFLPTDTLAFDTACFDIDDIEEMNDDFVGEVESAELFLWERVQTVAAQEDVHTEHLEKVSQPDDLWRGGEVPEDVDPLFPL